MTCTTESHEALKADPIAWAKLPAKPDWPWLGIVLQMRDCPHCQSTLSKPIADERSEAQAPARAAA